MNKSIFTCDKLVRDNDPKLMKARNMEVRTRVLGDHEYFLYLKKKIREEAIELNEAATPEEILSELVDIFEAAKALKKALGVDCQEFHSLMEEKRAKRGSYDGQICLCSVTLVQDHPEIAHYRSHPEKYPEKKISGTPAERSL